METRTPDPPAPPDLNDVAERLLALERWAGDISAYLAGQATPAAQAQATPAAQHPAATRAPVRTQPQPQPSAPTSAPTSFRARPARPRISLEDLLGGRVLGWAGGMAVLLGIAFFVAIAVNRGWIDEGTRIALAFAASLALLAAGVWLYERRGATQAATATTGAAIAALFVTLTAGRTLYELYPAVAGLAAALAVGALATALAIRWDSRTIGALGIVGALLAPVLVDAGAGGESVAYLAIALSSAVGVLVWRRWEWLGVTALAVTAPQLISWALDSPPAGGLVAVPLGFWALWALAALGHELRVPAAALRPSSSLVLVGGGLAAAVAAYWGPHDVDHPGLADATVAGLAGLNIACGLAALRARRIAHEIGLLLIAAGIVLGDVAFGAAASGPLVAIGWAGSALALAGLARVAADRDLEVLRVGLAGQLALSLVHTLTIDASPAALGDPGDLAGSLAALTGLAVAAFCCARLAAPAGVVRLRLDVVAMAALAYAGAFALDGVALALAWAAQGLALAKVAQRTDDELAAGGAAAFLGLAAAHVLSFEAPPEALVSGVDDLGAAVLGLGAFAGACLACARLARSRLDAAVPVLQGTAAAALVYLGSVAIVDAFASGGVPATAGLDGLGAEQQGQVALSAFWGLTGLGALIAGLVRDRREVRLAGFGLLVLALVKVFAFDLTALDSVYRVLSLVALGLLLLVGAFAYQRMRPGDGPSSPGGDGPIGT